MYEMSVEKKTKNRMKMALWLLLRPSWGNPQHISTVGIIFQVDHDQQTQTMIVMTAEVVKKQPQEVHGDFIRCGKKSLLVTKTKSLPRLLGITFPTSFQA